MERGWGPGQQQQHAKGAGGQAGARQRSRNPSQRRPAEDEPQQPPIPAPNCTPSSPPAPPSCTTGPAPPPRCGRPFQTARKTEEAAVEYGVCEHVLEQRVMRAPVSGRPDPTARRLNPPAHPAHPTCPTPPSPPHLSHFEEQHRIEVARLELPPLRSRQQGARQDEAGVGTRGQRRGGSACCALKAGAASGPAAAVAARGAHPHHAPAAGRATPFSP